MQELAILSGLVLSASCMVLQQQSVPFYGLQYDNPNYNFAYEVNDAHSGDIKSQHESRRGDTILGQYSLVQPDGVRRTVDYRAEDGAGFQANINHQESPVSQHAPRPADNGNTDTSRNANLGRPSNFGHQANYGLQSNLGYQHAPVPATPVAISRTSVIQTFTSGHGHNPWA